MASVPPAEHSARQDQEYHMMHANIDAEMKRCEAEMDRLRGQFEGYSPRRSAAKPDPPPTQEPQKRNTPLLADESSATQLKLKFDVRPYLPEEITVKTIDNKLKVHARHEEQSQNRTYMREYDQEFLLPATCNPDDVKSTLTADGILIVEAPLRAAVKN